MSSNQSADDLQLSSDSGDESESVPKSQGGDKSKSPPGPPKETGRPRKESAAVAQLAGFSKILTNYPMASLVVCCIFAAILMTGFEEYVKKKNYLFLFFSYLLFNITHS